MTRKWVVAAFLLLLPGASWGQAPFLPDILTPIVPPLNDPINVLRRAINENSTSITNASYDVNVRDYGAQANFKSAINCSIAAASTTLTCLTSVFAETDVGKRIVVDFAGAGNSALQTKIAGVTSGTTVTLTDAAAVATPYFRATTLQQNPALATTSNVVGAVTGYVPGDTVTLTGGTFTTATVLTVYGTQAWAASIVAGGTGGTVGGGLDAGDCTVRGTTGGTSEGTARAVIRVTLTGGAVTAIVSWTNRGFYTTNPTNPAAEPVVANIGSETPADETDSFGNLVPACTGLTGAIFGFNMGPGLSTTLTPGVYSVAPTNPTSQGSTSGVGTGATYTTNYMRAGTIAFYSDNYAAFAAAMAAANTQVLAGRRACIVIPAGIYGIRGTPGTPLPRLAGPGCVRGESAVGSRIFVDPGYSGDVFAENDSFLVTLLQASTIEQYDVQRHGSSYTGFSVVGDRLSANTQNAIKFYDRTDFAYIDDVTVSNLPGACLSFGTLSGTGPVAAWPRESYVNALGCYGTGTEDIPSVEYNTSGVGGAGTQIIGSISMYLTHGAALVVRGGVRQVQADQIRIEGTPNVITTRDLFEIGNLADTRNMQAHKWGLVSLVNVAPSTAALSVNCNATGISPFNIYFEQISIGGANNYGKGLNIRCGRSMSFGVSNITTRDTSVEVAAAPATGPPIEIRGSGSETLFNYAGAGLPNLSNPVRAAGTPGLLIPIGITLPYVVPGCQSGVPVTVRSATEAPAANCQLPALTAKDKIIVSTLWQYPASANVRQVKVRLHTATGVGGTAYMQLNAANTHVSANCETTINNASASNAQVGASAIQGGCIASNAMTIVPATSAVQTANGTAWINITANGDAAGVAAGEDIVLRAWSVKIQPGS